MATCISQRAPDRQFWLIWAVLCLNVSAGIGVIGMAWPMLQEIFGGALIGKPELGFVALDDGQRRGGGDCRRVYRAAVAVQHRRAVRLGLAVRPARTQNHLHIFFVLGIALYAAAPWAAHAGSKALFVLSLCVILSMYGGGFATVPAYLADMFGTQFVGAIHGRLLTAWATAGIIGPVVVNYIREFRSPPACRATGL